MFTKYMTRMFVHSNFTHNGQKLETDQISINRTDKLWQILYNKEKEQATTKGNNNMDGP